MSRHQFSRTLEGHCTAGAAGTASTGNAWCSGLSSVATTSSDLSWLDHVLLFEKAEFFLWPCGWKVQVTMGQAQIANQMGAYYRLIILFLSNDVHLLGLSFAGPSMRPWCLYIWLIFFWRSIHGSLRPLLWLSWNGQANAPGTGAAQAAPAAGMGGFGGSYGPMGTQVGQAGHPWENSCCCVSERKPIGDVFFWETVTLRDLDQLLRCEHLAFLCW